MEIVNLVCVIIFNMRFVSRLLLTSILVYGRRFVSVQVCRYLFAFEYVNTLILHAGEWTMLRTHTHRFQVTVTLGCFDQPHQIHMHTDREVYCIDLHTQILRLFNAWPIEWNLIANYWRFVCYSRSHRLQNLSHIIMTVCLVSHEIF